MISHSKHMSSIPTTCNIVEPNETNFNQDGTFVSYLTPRLITTTPIETSRPKTYEELVFKFGGALMYTKTTWLSWGKHVMV